MTAASKQQKRTSVAGFSLLTLGAIFFVLLNNLWPYSTPSRALDGSWAYVLHALAGKAHFGSELVFTYGPLGFLIAHGDTPDTYLWRLVFGGLLLLGVYWQICLLRFRGPGASPLTVHDALLFLAVAPLAVTYAFFGRMLFPDGATSLMLAFCMVNLVRLSAPEYRTTRLIIAASLATLALVKGTLIAIIAPFMILMLIRRVVFKMGNLDAPVATLLFFLALWLATGNQLLDLPNFLWATKEIASGFTTGMQADGAFQRQTRMAFLALSVLLALRYADSAGPSRIDRAIVGIVFLVLGLMLTKHGTDRFDGHVFSPAFTLFALSLVSFVAARTSWRAMLLSVAAVLVSTVTLNYALKSQVPDMSAQERRLWIAQGGDVIRQAREQLRLAGKLRNMQEEQKTHFDNVVAELGKGLPDVPPSQTVDIYSYKQGAVLARNFNYHPRPVFQSYSVYTPWLAKRNRDFLASTAAPDRIFFAIDPIDQKLAAMEDGLSWLELLSRYRLRGGFTFAGAQHLDLEKAPVARALAYGTPDTYRLEREAWHEVPSDGLLWLHGEPTQRSIAKSLLAQLYKSPIYWLELELDGGRVFRRRLIEPLMDSGFLLSPFIDNTRSFRQMARSLTEASPLERRVQRYRIVCNTNDACPVSEWRITATPLRITPDPSWARIQSGNSAMPITDHWLNGFASDSAYARLLEYEGHTVFHAPPTTVSIIRATDSGMEKAAQISICFGIMRSAYETGATDGVEFEIQVGHDEDWRQKVWSRYLNPSTNQADRGTQCEVVQLPGTQTELAFVTRPGKTTDWDLAYWQSVERVK